DCGAMRGKAPVFVALVLAGCTATGNELVYKKGSTDAERAGALKDCEFEAAKEIPAATSGAMTGRVSNAGLTECNSDGQCVTWGQVDIPPTVTSPNPHSGDRSPSVNRCLEKKGFTILNRPDLLQ